MRKSIQLLSLLFCILIVFFSCESPTVSKKKLANSSQSIKIGLKHEPLTLDPRKHSDGVTSSFLSFLYEGLMKKEMHADPSCALAEKVEISPCKTEYTFTLRKVNWSNGEPLLASDFQACWKQALDPLFGCYNPEYFFVIKGAKEFYEGKVNFESVGIKILSERELKVSLMQPNPFFLDLMTNKSFFPVYTRASLSPKEFVGIGPFLIEGWMGQDLIRLKRNPYYVEACQVKLDTIECHIISDEHTLISLYQEGELDWVGAPFSSLPFDGLAEIMKRNDFHTVSSASLSYYAFNQDVFPLSNLKIRQALSLAINRKELASYLLLNLETPARCLVPLKIKDKIQDFFVDEEEGKVAEIFDAALKEIGLTRQNFPKLTLSYPATQSRHLIAQAIQQQWLKVLGVEVDLVAKENPLFLADLYKRKYDIAAVSRGTYQEDPVYFLCLFKSTGIYGKMLSWKHPEFDALIEKAAAIDEKKIRSELLEQAERCLIRQMPISPLFFPSQIFLKNPRLKGVAFHETGFCDFKFSYKSMKKESLK